jgi:tRNA threonylcarbamoyl adenosine modification protein YeaZ
MLLLGIDTATSATTVAAYDGERALGEVTHVDPRRHAEILGPAIEQVFSDAAVTAVDFAAVVVGVGPGPYTGLRVGVATAVAFGDAVGVPVHGVCTLDALAFQAGSGSPLTVVTDARRREVFWARYDEHGGRIDGPAVNRPADLVATGTDRVVGPGALLYAEIFGAGAGPAQLSAAALCAFAHEQLACGRALLPARPIYLRRPDTAAPASPKPVLQP